tara:strand:- start:267 stop:659 length:393 start_codon:yes stop_codon:yes gene_type:complete
MILINTSMASLFKGFSTVDKNRAPFTLVNEDLVKRDLLNHLYTKKGERVMEPEFGTIIWDLVMEQKTELVEEQIKEDIQRIIDLDPRVSLIETKLLTSDHSIRAEVVLRYEVLNTEDILYLDYISNDDGV